MKAIYEMVDRNTSLLPVLESGNVIGVIRSVDVLNEVARILGIEEPNPQSDKLEFLKWWLSS
jgi:predicted transcriptional regulator